VKNCPLAAGEHNGKLFPEEEGGSLACLDNPGIQILALLHASMHQYTYDPLSLVCLHGGLLSTATPATQATRAPRAEQSSVRAWCLFLLEV